jgi:hypothetical protein
MNMSWIFVLMTLLSGGGNELLDFVPADAYWKSQNIEVSVEALTKELKAEAVADPAKPKAAASRRLMAIRTLGELKKAEAVESLKPFLTSKEPFEAEYAAEAIALIENKTPVGMGPVIDSMSDIWLMPANVGVVGQLKFLSATPAVIQEQFSKTIFPAEVDRAQAMEQINSMLISTAERIGNIRIDCISLSMSDEIGDDSGFAVVVARGTYDPKAIEALLAQNQMKSLVVDGMTVFKLENDSALILPSSDRAVFVFGPNEKSLPLMDVVAALKAGKGKLSESAEMAKLVQSMDTKQVLWATAKVPASYRAAPLLAPFDVLKLTGELKEGTTHLKFEAKGSDAAAVQKVVADVQAHIDSAVAEGQKVVEQLPMMKPIFEVMKSCEISIDGSTATLTAKMQGSPLALAFASLIGVRM